MSLFQSILLCLATISVLGQSKSVTVIPFTFENDRVYIYCKVNEADSLKFLFDTGADGSVINKQSLHKLNLKIDGQSLNVGSNGSNVVDISPGNIISFGNIKQENISLTIIPYGDNFIDGIFGANLMNDYIIEIDYDKNELRFYHPEDYQNKLDDYEKLKIHFINNYPAIKSSLVINNKNHTGYFGLDTGADDALTIASPYVKRKDLSKKMKKIGSATSQGSDGSRYENPVVLAPEIKIGEKSVYNVPINLSQSTEGIDATEQMAGFFGNNILKRFNVVLDLGKGVIYLKMNKNLYTPFY